MNNKKIAGKINYDIETGVYDMYPKLKSKIEHIAHKLVLATYVPNSKELSITEIEILKENDYLREE